eukprot:6200843-Pleurochrysis_carterae.AAC.4
MCQSSLVYFDRPPSFFSPLCDHFKLHALSPSQRPLVSVALPFVCPSPPRLFPCDHYARSACPAHEARLLSTSLQTARPAQSQVVARSVQALRGQQRAPDRVRRRHLRRHLLRCHALRSRNPFLCGSPRFVCASCSKVYVSGQLFTAPSEPYATASARSGAVFSAFLI